MTVPVAPRRRTPWGDARFLLGLLLVAVSIAGVWFVVASARDTVPVYAAERTLVPGQELTSDDVRIVDVALGQVSTAYIASDALPTGIVATRTIQAGELVPAAAVGPAAGVRTTSIVIDSSVDVPASLAPGHVVEVWESPLLEHGVYDAPRILVADATVVSVTRDESMIGGGAASLELVIARADVAATLAAVAGGSSLSVVPTAGGAR